MTQQTVVDNKRTALIKKNIIASFLIKGWSAVVQLLLVTLTLNCLGAYENGIWLTISSMLIWIDNFDIGLGNGLRNRLAEYIAHDDIDKARKAVSSTFYMLIIIIIPVVLIMNLLIWNLDLYTFLNINPNRVGNLNIILSTATILVCSTFIFKFIGNFYMGLQMPAINNLLVTSGQTLSLIGTAIIYVLGIRSLWLIAVVNTLSPLLVYLISYPFTFYRKYKNLRPSFGFVEIPVMKDLFNVGMKFFLLQMSAIILFMSSNIIISKYFSPEMVTPYQISYRYFSLIQLLFTIICVPYWTATTDAYQRNDKAWILQSNRMLNKIVLLIIPIVIIMITFSDFVYSIWIGSVVKIPFSMTVIMAIYIFILTVSIRYSFILNGVGALNLQLIMTITAAIVYIVAAVLISHFSKNINYLLILMCLVNTPGLFVNAIQYHKIINGKAKGIWRK